MRSILFPSMTFEPNRIDPDFAAEEEAARSVGFRTALYDHDALLAGDRWTSSDREISFVLRGWMVSGDIYAKMCSRLSLENSPEEYDHAHYIPGWYLCVEDHSARTQWIEGDNPDEAWALYQGFRDKDAIIKDWVKSAKYKWHDACFIPANTSEERFKGIFRVFRDERGNLFNKGVVLREFLPFRERGGKIADLPIIEEYRMFFWNGELFAHAEGAPVDNPLWEQLAAKMKVPFMTIDVGRVESGEWKVVECGAGSVSGLPQTLDPQIFYAALWNKVYE